jgi:hypothetical protein
MITFETPKHHWNYFLALEKDLENISRFIEFSSDNLNTYSIELTHLLLSASSEVVVLMKQLCSLVDPSSPHDNINDYASTIKAFIPSLINEEISIARFGLRFKPWDAWLGTNNPNWWRSYNNVKHQRNNHFREANLQNTVNSIGGLLITVIYYYKYSFTKEAGNDISFKETTLQLEPESTFIRINADYYYDHIVG